MHSKRPRNIPTVSYRFLSSTALTLFLIAALTPGAIAQDLFAREKVAPLNANVRAQIAALQAEKESRTTTERKIDSQLLFAYRMAIGQPIAKGINTLQVSVTPNKKGMVLVDMKAQVSVALLKQIARTGEIINNFPEMNSIRAWIPVTQVLTIAANPGIITIRPATKYMLSGGSISATPEWQSRHAAMPMASLPWTAQQREARVRDLLPGLLARARQSSTGNIAQAPPLPGLTPGFQANALAAMVLPLPPLYHEMASVFAAGNVDSEGNITHRANLARTTYSVDGRRMKIGVLSDGVNTLTTSQANGELGPVTVLPGQEGAGNEGTAMLEIVHDLAPGAKLYYATAFNGVESFAQNIRDLRAAGCDIIVDDVFYYDESPFQDGPIAQAVNDVTADGALYFSSAGNQGNKTDGTSTVWEGDFVDGGPATIEIGSGASARLHSFGGATSDQATGFPGGVLTATLFWADPLGKSTNDYDLYILDAAGTSVVNSATSTQNGSQDPYEQVDIGNNARLVIVKHADASARFLHLNILENGGGGHFIISTDGQTKGHASSVDAFCVAATPVRGPYPGVFNSGNRVEGFSSDGPRHVFFNADGSAITPGNFSSTGGSVRPKPDITAADGGRTSVPGFDPFYGTSAAAPHAAAIAGLLKDYNQSLTPSQVRAALETTAIDIMSPGNDRDSGAGIIDAVSALASVAPAPLTSVVLGAASVKGNKAVQGTVTLHDPAPNGGAVVSLSATPSGIVSLPASVTVPAGQKTANFTLTTAPVTGDKLVTVKANYRGITETTPLHILARYLITGGVTTMDGSTPINGVALTASAIGTGTLPTQTISPNTSIPDGTNTGAGSPVFASLPVASTGTVSGVPVSSTGTLTSIKVGVNISHSWRGDLRVTLVHPDGTTVLLKDIKGSDNADNVITSYPDLTASVGNLSTLIGKPVNGTWKLQVQDFFRGDIGTLNSFNLTLVADGIPVTLTAATGSSGTYSFTDQFPGSFTVTPSKTGFDFNPKSLSASIGPDKTGLNFALTQVGVRLSATAAFVSNEYRVTLTCANGSSAAANNLQITRATLGGSATPIAPALPTNLGNIPSGNSGSVVLRYPVTAGSHGARVLLKVSGTSSAGAIGGTLQVTLP